MQAATVRKSPKLIGESHPRIAPPTPAKSRVSEYAETAKGQGIELMPWQYMVGRYLYAVTGKGAWIWPEVAALVGRQNGKTELIVPHIIRRLVMGRRILHAAQTRELPRLTFHRIAPVLEDMFPDAKVRRATGQETIELPNGGFYRITAATSGGPRGMSMDDVIIDELREIEEDFMQAVQPTIAASDNPQILYLSNAGEEHSTVLNGVRNRAAEDPSLAYLEWSAAPERSPDDIDGWREANPSIGHIAGILPYLERAYRSHKLAGTLAGFETENLVRWVATVQPRLVEEHAWLACKADVGEPRRASLAVSMDPSGRRASVAMAWREGDGVALRVVLDVNGDPVNTDDIGKAVKGLADKYNIREVGYNPATDAELVKYVRKARKVWGAEWRNASAQFLNLVTGRKLRWQDADAVTEDLTWTMRKNEPEGAFQAVHASDDKPITASLAAIRAVQMASGPTPATPRVL